ncbi:hypothetical protein TNIN_215411 [Trichonephila inaurata madagascariensis]|uniref:Uncharacterized protein n=1 Tax=Trichonephila inaurata madagascariensis TaxID=2747483 RepID=A0A8X6IBW7_9ARAC|nr:hypothetical protein TNIN_215411 [Trichonephila inaurata madagascariensis]
MPPQPSSQRFSSTNQNLKTQSPPAMQPQRTPSPTVLLIVPSGDISLPPVPEILELEAAWKSKLTGSPPKRAFSPPTFAQVLQRQPPAKQRQTLLSCAACDRKFYTKSV